MKNVRTHQRYIPALRFEALTPFYDAIVRWTLRERAFKERLVQQADLRSRYKVLDVGCGTGTLTLLAKETCPDARLVGLDGDASVLKLARRKAAAAGLEVRFDRSVAFDLPYEDNSFDRVLSTLLFHHLLRENKSKTLQEVFRVLRPGGELHIADWGKPANVLMRSAFLLVQVLDGFETTSDHVHGVLRELALAAGFQTSEEHGTFITIFGTIELLEFRKPAGSVGTDRQQGQPVDLLL